MRKLLSAVAMAGVFTAAAAAAEPVTIKFTSPSPPKAHLNVQIFGPWSKEVTAASGGTLNVKLVAGPVLANHRNVFDRVRKNVAAIGWGLQGLVPGQFPGSDIVALPANYETSVEGSLALWKLYKDGLISGEYRDVKALAIFAFPPSGVHANVPIARIEDLKGMKLATAGKMRALVARSLGGVPISLSPPQTYQSVSRGLVKGTVMAWTAFAPYRYAEVVSHHIKASLGGSAGMIFMNKKAFARLPAKAKQAIEANTGDKLVRRFAAFWDRINAGAQKRIAAMKGHIVTELDPAETRRWEAALQPINASWVKETPDGAKLLKVFRAEIARVRASK